MVKDAVTGQPVEEFVPTLRVCQTCREQLHVYLFPYTDKRRGRRSFKACLGCLAAGR